MTVPTAALSLLDRPCTLVAAAAGYGKTSAVRRLLAGATTRWQPWPVGRVPGTALTELAQRAARAAVVAPCWLVLDDLPRLAGAELTAVLRVADRLPEGMRLVLITRHVPAPRLLAAARGRGRLGWVGPAELALSRAEVAATLRGYDLTDPALVRPVHTLTLGWPALVHLLAQAICDSKVSGDDLEPILRAEPPGGRYLAQEVFPALPADQRRLLRPAAHLDPVIAELCDPDDPSRATRLLPRLVEAGLLTPAGPDRPGLAPVPLVAMAARRALPLPAGQVTELLSRAARWYAAQDLPAAALRGYRLTGARTEAIRLLRRAGDGLVAEGAAGAVVAAVDALPGESRPGWLRRLYADALRVRGESEAAAAHYRTLAGRGTALPPGVAWRHGLLHYLRGEVRETLAVLTRGRLAEQRTVDEAMLLAWTACAYAMWGDAAACVERARRALAVVAAATAAAPGWAEAQLVAHVAASLGAGLTGQPSVVRGHLVEADRAARTARDATLRAWARAHVALAHNATARYPAALAESTAAIEQAETAGCPAVLALALVAAGGALAGSGRLDEALDRYQRAASIQQRLGSPQVAQALTGIGELHLRRGRHSLARATYEEAVRVSETAGNRAVLVPALSGLARVAARDDPATAEALARRAVVLARGPETISARCALGWAAVAGGDRNRAAHLAAEAVAQARSYHDRAGLVVALELCAATAEEAGPAREALVEAVSIHHDGGARIDADRAVTLLGRLPGAGDVERIEARLAAARLAEAGVSVSAGTSWDPGPASVAVHTLGRFEVVVAGRAVPTSAWQSRKARDLLRILAARRGRPVSRDQLAELLWPGEAPERVGHRLSVQLSILRGVLDPRRRSPQDRYVVAERASVALDVAQVELDVELFRAEASHGLRRFETGAGQDGADVLALAERRYLGDFLADDPYDDWAVPVRDEVRRLYLRVVRALAVLARRRGDLEQASSELRRALEVEPYDEHIHRELVEVLTAAGRHGEAEQAQRRYREAMAVLGVPVPPASRPPSTARMR